MQFVRVVLSLDEEVRQGTIKAVAELARVASYMGADEMTVTLELVATPAVATHLVDRLEGLVKDGGLYAGALVLPHEPGEEETDDDTV